MFSRASERAKRPSHRNATDVTPRKAAETPCSSRIRPFSRPERASSFLVGERRKLREWVPAGGNVPFRPSPPFLGWLGWFACPGVVVLHGVKRPSWGGWVVWGEAGWLGCLSCLG